MFFELQSDELNRFYKEIRKGLDIPQPITPDPRENVKSNNVADSNGPPLHITRVGYDWGKSKHQKNSTELLI